MGDALGSSTLNEFNDFFIIAASSCIATFVYKRKLWEDREPILFSKIRVGSLASGRTNLPQRIFTFISELFTMTTAQLGLQTKSQW